MNCEILADFGGFYTGELVGLEAERRASTISHGHKHCIRHRDHRRQRVLANIILMEITIILLFLLLLLLLLLTIITIIIVIIIIITLIILIIAIIPIILIILINLVILIMLIIIKVILTSIKTAGKSFQILLSST
jgi:hypothetical protein